ncbi:GNAT family N-acetyltransferase [Kineococcus rhizosphaerae]|uniref:Acetyltransferase (GNAT) family protein n=1 Tax=Kineococcus rhizosphaerae TaxID=559628 RepID=A0A2T0R5S5_9ACTN|nr:GNAT family N-acetyltransferase [Kineococcus rhizosphaerae]PRY16126.1 acetyltransferase (GNAT) family protein [Kineococcus rhizosphaerae]
MSLQIHPRPLGDPDLDTLIEAAVAELNVRYRTPGEPDVEYPLAPEAVCHVAYLDGAPAGCIARVDVDEPGWDATVEMKRVFVRPQARGRGAARALVARFEAEARAAGARRVRLETGTLQPEAMALYEALGYERLAENFGPWADSPLSVCYAKSLP